MGVLGGGLPGFAFFRACWLLGFVVVTRVCFRFWLLGFVLLGAVTGLVVCCCGLLLRMRVWVVEFVAFSCFGLASLGCVGLVLITWFVWL